MDWKQDLINQYSFFHGLVAGATQMFHEGYIDGPRAVALIEKAIHHLNTERARIFAPTSDRMIDHETNERP